MRNGSLISLIFLWNLIFLSQKEEGGLVNDAVNEYQHTWKIQDFLNMHKMSKVLYVN